MNLALYIRKKMNNRRTMKNKRPTPRRKTQVEDFGSCLAVTVVICVVVAVIRAVVEVLF